MHPSPAPLDLRDAVCFHAIVLARSDQRARMLRAIQQGAYFLEWLSAGDIPLTITALTPENVRAAAGEDVDMLLGLYSLAECLASYGYLERNPLDQGAA